MQYSPAHGGMVTGAAIDALNRHSISCGRDGHVKVWFLKSGRLRFDVNVGSPIVKMKFHHGNNLAAIACENFTTYIFDAEAGRLVRRFPGHEDRITAVEMSPDGRWLLTSAMDLTVRTWHVVSGRPLDAFQVPTAVVGLSMSPSSDLLATIHLNRRGIYLWANKAMYSGIDDSDLLPAPLSLPAATTTDGAGTNSSVPAVQMPILIGPNEGAEGEEEDEEGRRVGGRGVGAGDVAVIAGEGGGGRGGMSLEESEMDTELMRAIRRGAQSEPADYSQAMALLKAMSPSAVDLELRAIEIVDDSPSPADLHRVALFMSFLEGKLRGSCDFELLQAVTHRFLAIHGSAISSFPQLRAKLPAFKEAQASSWQRLDELFQSIRCVVDFIASS
ncbi:unnamed protein product [Closterium sp. Yama58-4]|nr:unnamed protein product [Closterium sp. Yama58-4]